MRPLHIVCLLALAVVVGGLRTQAAESPRHERADAAGDRHRFTATVMEVGLTPEDAEQVAYRSARKQILEFLAQQRPPLTWRRAPDELDRFVEKESVRTEEIADQKLQDLGFRYRTTLSVELEPRDFREILEQNHEHELEERHWLTGKILAGLVALLGTVAIYFRLDEWTKGYCTTWLRIGAATLLSAVLGGLLMLP